MTASVDVYTGLNGEQGSKKGHGEALRRSVVRHLSQENEVFSERVVEGLPFMTHLSGPHFPELSSASWSDMFGVTAKNVKENRLEFEKRKDNKTMAHPDQCPWMDNNHTQKKNNKQRR
ncbi:Threonine synthase-like 1 [Clarias magur]|uniref:Threonine synthase-like 1 n=1 Tax=Clarias magur TaxID=1594786 RepID=A0A8J4XJP7_CLAMG|nr:Threonine synthase-like 1 [Clarias magur]